MKPIDQAKQIANESNQLVESLEAETGVAVPGGQFTNYSSSTNSCTVDPETGVITLTTQLFPGDTPIEPAPVDGGVPTPAEEPTVPPDEVPPVAPPAADPAPDAAAAEGFKPVAE
jgi:hypothetical protein